MQVPNAIDNERIAKRFPAGVHEEKIEQGIQIESYNTKGEEFISIYGSIDDCDQEMMLKAVVNEKLCEMRRKYILFYFSKRRPVRKQRH